ncbi:MAG: AraC family transcriptional regulator, partial [Bradyrhizobium sp.]
MRYGPPPKKRPTEPRLRRKTMDVTRRDSGHLMLITPERVFYAGLLGRPRQRCSGA